MEWPKSEWEKNTQTKILSKKCVLCLRNPVLKWLFETKTVQNSFYQIEKNNNSTPFVRFAFVFGDLFQFHGERNTEHWTKYQTRMLTI